MDRRRTALYLLLAFTAGIAAAIIVSGARPASDPGLVPWVAQVAAYLCAVAAGVLLLAPAEAEEDAGVRRLGSVVLGAVVVLALVDAFTMAADSGGADIGAGLVRLVGLVVIMVATIRLARGVAAAGRAR